MYFVKALVMAVLPFALQVAAAPASTPGEIFEVEARACVAPTNCGGPVGNCEYCCSANVRPNSATCHSHGGICPNGSTKWHCDDTTQ
ncbi:hypothetical protein DL770_008767 [Monosporascus sp. CRB-9-2]|nr:hypothetical protein DL770_008767 [Monosporascus sp. CRB-9-2]